MKVDQHPEQRHMTSFKFMATTRVHWDELLQEYIGVP